MTAPTDIPPARTPLIDHSDELQAVCDLLRRSDVDLVTLTDMAGMGLIGRLLDGCQNLRVGDKPATAWALRRARCGAGAAGGAGSAAPGRAPAGRSAAPAGPYAGRGPVERARAVVDLCRELDGLPLAIELAVGRTRSLSPTALRNRLDRRLEVHAGGLFAAPAAGRALPPAARWSLAGRRPEQLWPASTCPRPR